MKVTNIVGSKPTEVKVKARRLAEAAPANIEMQDPQELGDHTVIFPSSDQFRHMLDLISQSDKKLYNRIVGLD